MDFRARIIELLQISEGRIDCDAGFSDDKHYRHLYVQAIKKRDLISSENKILVGIIRKRLSEPPVNLSSTRIMDRYASSPNRLVWTAKEARQLEVLLQDYEALLSHEQKTKDIVTNLLITWELARHDYSNGKRSDAAQFMNWTSGKRGKVNPDREVFFSYIKLTSGSNGQPKIKGHEAVKIIKEKYNLHSEDAVIQILKRVKKAYKDSGVPCPAFRIPKWFSSC
jgi:hypothetical protein